MVFCLSLIGQSGLASELGGYTGTSNRMSLDPRAAGTGGITLFENTSDNAFAQSPASQAWQTNRSFNAAMIQLSLDRYVYSVNFGMPLPPTAHLNLGLISAGTKHIEARDSRGYYAGDMDDSEMTYFLSFSNAFSEKLAFGLSFKFLSKQFSSDDGWLDLKGTGFGANVGLLFKPLPGSLFAIAVKDWNASYKWKTQDLFDQGSSYRDAFPMSLAYGWQQDLGYVKLALEHDHYFIGEDIFRAALLLDGLKDLSINTGFSLEDGTIIPGASARYHLKLPNYATSMHIDLGISGGVEHEGVRTYLGWGANFK